MSSHDGDAGAEKTLVNFLPKHRPLEAHPTRMLLCGRPRVMVNKAELIKSVSDL
jgi:hypothetical protein